MPKVPLSDGGFPLFDPAGVGLHAGKLTARRSAAGKRLPMKIGLSRIVSGARNPLSRLIVTV